MQRQGCAQLILFTTLRHLSTEQPKCADLGNPKSALSSKEGDMSFIKQAIRKTPLYKPARKLYRKFRNVPRHPLQDMPPVDGLNLVHLGTEYGGWMFLDDASLNGCTIISAGLGEDGSFDVEFADKYDANVIIVDPTPRAIMHFRGMSERLGRPSDCGYSEGGRQPLGAYDLSHLGPESLTLVEKALWDESMKLKFFEPADPRHVSHSIINYQHEYSGATSHIEVEAITLAELMADLNLEPKDIPLIKLDIEGAEIEVLTHAILTDGFRPRQILVEFDELNVPSKRGFERVSTIHRLLTRSNYEMVCTNGQADFLYVRPEE